MPIQDEVIPLHDLVVQIRDPLVNRVHLEPEGEDLPLQNVGGVVTVTVPVINQHSMVVAEHDSSSPSAWMKLKQ
jgi:hypothetical protein